MPVTHGVTGSSPVRTALYYTIIQKLLKYIMLGEFLLLSGTRFLISRKMVTLHVHNNNA